MFPCTRQNTHTLLVLLHLAFETPSPEIESARLHAVSYIKGLHTELLPLGVYIVDSSFHLAKLLLQAFERGIRAIAAGAIGSYKMTGTSPEL